MKRMVLGVMLSVAASACATDETSTVASELAAPKRYLVVFRSESLPKDAATRISKAGGKVVRLIPEVGLAVVSGTSAVSDKLTKDTSVLAIGPEHYFRARKPTVVRSSSVSLVNEWAVGMQWDMRRIGAPALWDRGLPRASTVAVLDTGVMYDHPELAETVTSGVTTSYCSTDRTGYPIYDQVADLNVGECVFNTGPHYIDDAFHGTHVAGTIAAPINAVGIVGVSPTTKIAAYKVFDLISDSYGLSLGAFDAPIFDAIVHAVSSGHKVINMSLGGVLDRSTRDGNAAWLAWSRVTGWAYRKGTLIVAAAGNETTNNNGTTAFIPSDLPSVMSVSATGTRQLLGDGWAGEEVNAAPGSDVLTVYSNYGAAVDVAAPGGDCGPTDNCTPEQNWPYLILSSCAFARYDDEGSAVGLDAYWCWAAGTSMAAPHVAGVAAAVRAIHPTWTVGDTRSWLKSTATPVGPRQGFGAGLVNADTATR